MYTVTVYTTPNCIRCDITRRALDKAGINHRTVDVAADPALREYVTAELGYTEAPVVVVDQDADHHWSGFRPDKIKALAGTNATISGNGEGRP